MALRFEAHAVGWTPEQLRRFWAYFGTHAADRAYFSSHSGDAVVAFAERYVPISRCRVLDYGCGPGFLLDRLLGRGIHAEGLDFSAETVERVRQRCEGHPCFDGVTLAEGVPTPVPVGSKDVVFLVEVLEHLPADYVAVTLEDIRRILRGVGWVVVTTPHDEDIESAKTICPDCGAIFHPWQHVGSYTVPGMTDLLRAHGFEAVVCRATTLGRRWPGRLAACVRRVLAPGAVAEPHLVYIGRKQV